MTHQPGSEARAHTAAGEASIRTARSIRSIRVSLGPAGVPGVADTSDTSDTDAVATRSITAESRRRMPIMACTARRADPGEPAACSSLTRSGTICQDSPNLSVSQPHIEGAPSATKRSQNASASSWVRQVRTTEAASSSLKWGPPLRAPKRCPPSSNSTYNTCPGRVCGLPPGSSMTLVMRPSGTSEQ